MQQKVRVVSLARDMPTGLYLCLYQTLSKYFKPLRSYEMHKNWLRNPFRGDNKKKRIKQLFFLRVILLLDLIHVPAKYDQIISIGIVVIACTRFQFHYKESESCLSCI